MITLGALTYNQEVINSFKFQIVTTTPNETVTLPILAGGVTKIQNFTAYWGDTTSSEITAYNDPDRIHTYVVAGTYDIEMIGKSEYLAYSSTTVAERNKVRKLLAFTGDMGFKVLNFYGCTNLNSIVSFGTLASWTTASNLFFNCESLTGLVSGMFDGCRAINNLSNAFEQCDNASFTTIPNDLFKYVTNNTTFKSTFSSCSKITTIPTDLFRYNVATNNFFQTFYGCSSLTSIPTDIFRYNVLVTSFSIAFYGCSSLTSIPIDIFRYNTLASNFTGTFTGCTSLTSIPVDTFRYNTLATSFSECFRSCTGITTIPDDLFKYNTAVTSFNEVFSTCSALTAIPTDLFKYNVSVTTMSYVFNACSEITSIPTDLFRYNTLVTTFARAFSVCTKLTTVPTDIFRYNTACVSFTYVFNGCSVLASVPDDLFRYNTLVTIFTYSFMNCVKLQVNATIFYADGEQATRFLNKTVSFSSCFNRSSFSGTIGTAPDLWNCDFGTGTPTKTNCYGGAGNSLTSLSNYADIPVAWRT